MNLKEIKEQIDLHAQKGDFHSLDNKYGLHLLLDEYYFTRYTDCIGYILGSFDYWDSEDRVMNYFLPENKISKAEPLSLVVYGSSTNFKDFKHLGIVTQNLTIISKWGLSPVFEHPTKHVPESYGEHVEYFRVDINEITELCHPSLINFLNLDLNTRSSHQ